MGTWIGQSVARREDLGLLRGERAFVADLTLDASAWGDTAHVHFVRSHIAHGRILSIDVAEAEQQPGVIAVITSADHDIVPLGSVMPEYYPARFAMPLLAERVVRFVGEPIAAVVAESRVQAVDAAESVVIDIDPLPAVIDPNLAAADEVLLFADDTTARVRSTGDPGAATNTALLDECPHDPSAFEADVVIRQRFWNPRQAPVPIEPHGQLTAWSPDGHLHVWASTQRPHGFRDQLADLFQLDPTTIHVHAPDVGGGFGGKVSRTQVEHALPMIAQLVGRPVRWVETRGEYLTEATQGRGEQIDFVLAGDASGRIHALRGEVLKDSGAYPGVGANLPGRFNALDPSGPYAIEHVEFAARSVVTNAPQISAFRGAGRAPYHAALERLLDIYARRIGLDAVEVRRRNLLELGDMPLRGPGGVIIDEADHHCDLTQVLAMANYDALRSEQAQRRAEDAPIQLGIGVSTFHLLTVGAGAEEAIVRLESDGSITVLTGTTDQGHGHSATWAQLVADELGVDPEVITVLEGSTDHTTTGVGAVGSRSLQTAGMAILGASRTLVSRAQEIAARSLEADLADIVFSADDGGSFHVAGVPARSMSWAAVAAASTADERDEQSDRVQCGEIHDIGDTSTFPSGAYVAVVEIDVETGAVRLRQFHGVDDVGVRINPMIVEGQLHGGIAAGISQALGEEMVYDDDGTPLTTSFIDYSLATTDLLPSFDLESSHTQTSQNELGAKGAGEAGTVGAVPAVHNAVLDAVSHVGVEHFDLPCTPRRIHEAIRAAQSSRSV